LNKANDSRVLISGMGSSFGLLYSAVHHVKPSLVVVLTSEKYRENAVDACARAGFVDKERLLIMCMQDVFCGFSEAMHLVEQCRPSLQGAGSIVVNLTGGTTAMQWVMQSIFEQARKDGLPVERVAFVDRRPAVDQQQNPWHLGEIVEIEKMMKKN